MKILKHFKKVTNTQLKHLELCQICLINANKSKIGYSYIIDF